MKNIMYIFPGQGSQYQGIGYDIYNNYSVAKNTYDQASSILGYDMAELSFNDPEHKISLTEFTQPVLLTHQIACYRVFNELTSQSIQPILAAGHSLGEYTALIISEMLSFEEGLNLVRKRGQLMSQYGDGSMLAMPLEQDEAMGIAEQYNCQVATINLAKQTVIGGTDQDIDLCQNACTELFPKKRTVKLDTEGAFHTDLMKKAADEFMNDLNQAQFTLSKFKVLSNFTTDIHKKDGSLTKELLFQQLYRPVNWLGCMKSSIAFDIDTIVEFGGGIGIGKSPAEKRPNLESITKKNFRGFGQEIKYCSAINTESIEESVKYLTQ